MEAVKIAENENRAGTGEHEYIKGLLLLENKNYDKLCNSIELNNCNLKNIYAVY